MSYVVRGISRRSINEDTGMSHVVSDFYSLVSYFILFLFISFLLLFLFFGIFSLTQLNTLLIYNQNGARPRDLSANKDIAALINGMYESLCRSLSLLFLSILSLPHFSISLVTLFQITRHG